jgi:cytochrome b6-f complex iron-sulfur subunit
MQITRKEFFVKTAQGVAILSIPSIFGSFLESCNSPTGPNNAAVLPSVQGTVSNGTVIVIIDSSSALAKAGSAAIVTFSSGFLLVDHTSGNNFVAMSAICPHQGCTVSNFDSGSSQFVCPCHGSRFDMNGKVVQGPAASNLQVYQTQFSNNKLTIIL